ncbi:Thiamine biosynthetic bifunctional enzyme TH1 [Picochlorum sp. SENEW3]|nr:Thiamine biosynthetic bifunctional enzyme TH1 [Picochlorum sp. SENEW3]
MKSLPCSLCSIPFMPGRVGSISKGCFFSKATPPLCKRHAISVSQSATKIVQVTKATSNATRVLWEENQHLYYASLFNPFVRGIADGTLPRERFEKYLSQDVYYLSVFREAIRTMLQLAAVDPMIADDHKTGICADISHLLETVETELDNIHGTFIDLENLSHDDIMWATSLYTEFLARVASNPSGNDGAVHVASSLLPCFRLYAEVARKIKTIAFEKYGRDPEDHPYGKWILEYSSDHFLRCVSMAESVLDVASHDAITKDRCHQHYSYAMKKELQFFGANTEPKINKGRGILVVDFDETSSQGDTISKIVDAAYHGDSVGPEERQHKELLYKKLLSEYVSEREDLLGRLVPEGLGASPVKGQEWLAEFLMEVSKFDSYRNKVCFESSLLSGATPESLQKSANGIAMQPRCPETLQHALDCGMHAAVVSVNWSSEMIEKVFQRHGIAVEVVSDLASVDMEERPGVVHIIANRMEFDGGDRSTGLVHTQCENATDKAKIMIQLQKESDFSIYVGDSVTDIGSLMEASMGIIFGENQTLMSVLRIAGIPVLPLEDFVYNSNSDGSGKVLYQTNSWDEIYGVVSAESWCSEREETASVSHVPRVMLISGSDSGGGAGLQADIKTCTACGSFATNAVAAITVQNTVGVESIYNIPSDIVQDQIRYVYTDIGADCIKIGMLGSVDNVIAVSEAVKRMPSRPPIVLDPVLASSSGSSLAEQGIIDAMKEHLFPVATVVTPNIPEAIHLLDDNIVIDSVDSMKLAAEKLYKFGPRYVLIKGGHLQDGSSNAIDVLFDGKEFVEFSTPLLNATNNHGTGCSLASAIASYVSQGENVLHAVDKAKKFVWRAMERSSGLNIGQGDQKPMNLSYGQYDWPRSPQTARVPNPVDVSLYAVTSPSTTSEDRSDEEILQTMQSVIAGGATVIQIRDKVSEGGRLTRIVSKIVRLCRPAGVKVIVNDRVDVAIAADACGVHVGQGDIPAAHVRKMIGQDKIVGVSCKTVELALKAQRDGADYVGCGATYPTITKDSSVIGTHGVRQIKEHVSIPVVAIGGIDDTNASRTLQESGADGVAVVRAIFNAKDIEAATANLKDLTRTKQHKDLVH